MQLIKSAIIETPDTRLVEMVFTDGPELDLSREHLTLRVPVDVESSPRLPEALLEALRSARNVIGDEIQRLEQKRGRGD